MFFKSLFCSHAWNKVAEHTSESTIEHLRKNGYNGPIRIWTMDELSKKTYTCILTCSKCGKVKKIVT